MTCDARWVKLPHLDILNRKSGAQGHSDAIARIYQRVGRARVDTASAPRRKHRRLRFDVHGLTRFDTYGNHANDRPILLLDEIDDEPFRQKRRPGPQIRLI